MAPKMSKRKMEELLESSKKEGISHVTANVVKELCNKNIPAAIPLQTASVAFAPTSKAPTNPTLWAKHLREFNEGPKDSLWNLSNDQSEIVDEHILRRADEAKFARTGDIGICKAQTSHNLRTTAMKKLEDDVVDYQRGFAEQYRDGFENAISQIRIIAPNVDVSKVDKYKVVRDGMIVFFLRKMDGMIVDEEEDEET
ncbi:unnamed protein product [Trifolium pratense]|uniref:Uncharacterized protein n=1 Tax=Trifolium pratense TaxID=57577 RepID=A0ACB0KL19_TRIPR|nr:unnamed protein product [Trifolium pratense]